MGWGGWRELINRCYMSRCLHKMKIRFLSAISLVVKKITCTLTEETDL